VQTEDIEHIYTLYNRYWLDLRFRALVEKKERLSAHDGFIGPVNGRSGETGDGGSLEAGNGGGNFFISEASGSNLTVRDSVFPFVTDGSDDTTRMLGMSRPWG
jgi:hypothetical protein